MRTVQGTYFRPITKEQAKWRDAVALAAALVRADVLKNGVYPKARRAK